MANRLIGEPERTWMKQCPDIASFCHQGERYAGIQGGMSDVARFIGPICTQDVFEAEWDLIEQAIGTVNHVIAGYCGLPFQTWLKRGKWPNAGVIGMPPHDPAANPQCGAGWRRHSVSSSAL